MTERPQTIPLLRLIPVEFRAAVRTLFRTWHAALATDQRFSSLRKAAAADVAEAAEAVRDGFEWRATLRPAGLPAGLDFKIRLLDKSASYPRSTATTRRPSGATRPMATPMSCASGTIPSASAAGR